MEQDWRIELVGFFPHNNNNMYDFKNLLPTWNIEAQGEHNSLRVLVVSSEKYESKEQAIIDAKEIGLKAKLIADHGYIDVVEPISMECIEITGW